MSPDVQIAFARTLLLPTKYLTFKHAENPGRMTGVWHVLSAGSGAPLGTIRWYGPWRQYCFWPAAATIFNTDCLRTIEDRVATCNRVQRNIRANLAGGQT